MRTFLFLLVAATGFNLWASPDGDARYSFKSILVAVTPWDPENVHSAHVQAEMGKFFQNKGRYEVFQPSERPQLGDLSKTTEAEITPWLDKAHRAGADSAILAQVQREGLDYKIVFAVAVMEPTEFVFRKTVPVRDRMALESFGVATREVLSEFLDGLPFDATIIARDSYRVVIDRGVPGFRPGTRIAAYTLDKAEGGIAVEQSGVIAIQRVEKNLSFGTVIVENKPLEVDKGNKVRFQTLGTMPVEVMTAHGDKPSFSREIASTPEVSSNSENWLFDKERLGSLEAHFMTNLVTWGRTAANTGSYQTDTGVYTGANLRAEIKLTRQAFAELGGTFGTATLNTNASGTPVGLTSQTNEVRAAVGYRLGFQPSGNGPSMHIRAGWARTQFQVDELPGYLAPSSVVFGGLLLGGGFLLPFTERMGMGLDASTRLFPSLNEGAGTSGATTKNIAAWDFSLKGYYHLTEKMTLEGRLAFQTGTAEFTGQGTRPIAVSSLSQSARGLLLGLNYFF